MGQDYVSYAITASSRPVRSSAEFKRILALPRRPSADPPAGWADQWRTPGGALQLQPLQARALYELATYGRLMAPMPVGTGKTLVALLAGTVLGVQRIVLLVPKPLKTQLLKQDLPFYGASFRLPADLTVVAYSSLSSKKQADILERLNPGLVVCDEAHAVAGNSKRTRVFRRFFKDHPQARLIPLSGTFITRSIKEAAPLATLALGDQSPYPRDYNTLEAWHWPLDDHSLDLNPDPGVLTQLCTLSETVREGFGRRVLETPGVVGATSSDCPASLVIQRRLLDDMPGLDRLRSHWELPDGTEVDSPLALYQAAQQLACGFYLKRVFRDGDPVKEWTLALQEWNAEVRERLKRSSPGMDSPGTLYDAAESGRWRSATWARWSAVRHSVRYTQSVTWVSDILAADAVKWSKTPGIIWVDYPALGRRLQAMGLPYYGEGMNGELLLAETGKRAIVASMRVVSDGWNLQQFHRQLFTAVPSTSKEWHQAIGRCHRPYQRATQVDVWVYQHTEEFRRQFADARRNAQFIKEVGREDHKLQVARVL